jgi:hypothetical protein
VETELNDYELEELVKQILHIFALSKDAYLLFLLFDERKMFYCYEII